MSGTNTHLSMEIIMDNIAKEAVITESNGCISPKEEYEVVVDCLGENTKDRETDISNVNFIEERYWRIVNGEEHCKIIIYSCFKLREMSST